MMDYNPVTFRTFTWFQYWPGFDTYQELSPVTVSKDSRKLALTCGRKDK